MSTGRAIEAVTQALRAGLASLAPVTARPLDRARTGAANGPQLNLYLYDVAPNAAWRNLEPPTQAGGGAGLHPPLALDLRYLLTAYGDGDDEIAAHRLLGEAMQVLHDGAVLARAGLKGVLAEAGVHLQPDRVRLTPVHLGTDEQSRLWTAFQTNYRISVAYQVSVVLIDTLDPPAAPLPVLKRGRAPVDEQGRDEGVPAGASAGPRLDRVTVEAWRGNDSVPARTGDRLVVEGAGLTGGPVRARFDHPRLAQPIWADAAPGSTAARVLLSVPAALPAGFATLVLAVGPPEGPRITSNALPLPVAVRLGRPSVLPVPGRPGTVRVTVPSDRLLVDDQAVLLLAGGGQTAPNTRVRAGAVLSFDLPHPGAAGAVVTLRLRVDGVDSVPLPEPDPAKPLPTRFDPVQQVVLP
ncbi:DUF4255 domain-containing protein [Kitasatospora sp. RG8]|uniref:DUF4255 domain-containing protein n=1 Tax=Kitasatospora sp. RG8 TaxID=2820815 RepID=UPI001AE0653E|nr:DUF4255 domain-containing protein [Kitasatospora sp. RG8]MBP0452553.1 DUF4255 domain-containing protein [Kitasatospora sp. RG8]